MKIIFTDQTCAGASPVAAQRQNDKAGGDGIDLLLIGAGLANSLIALRLSVLRPEIRWLMLDDKADAFAIPKTWSFHESDVTTPWLFELVSTRWDGYDVLFPQRSQSFGGAYFSIRSEDFVRKVKARVFERARFGARVIKLGPGQVELADGQKIYGRMVLDGRGFGSSVPYACGYQKFAGLHVELSRPHGLGRPRLMDATVSQQDGYRFIYVLPWSQTELLVEDTIYSNNPELDVEALEGRIEAYIEASGWTLGKIIGREQGVLPVPLAGSKSSVFPAGIALSGVAAGRYHPSTGYSLTEAARFADRIASLREFDAATADRLNSESISFWNDGDFFRRLNNMMFQAAEPAERWRVLAQFYNRDETLIRRFYRGKLTPFDRIKMLTGKPPVAVGRGLKAFFKNTDGERSLLA